MLNNWAFQIKIATLSLELSMEAAVPAQGHGEGLGGGGRGRQDRGQGTLKEVLAGEGGWETCRFSPSGSVGISAVIMHCVCVMCLINQGLPWWLSGKESVCKAGASRDAGLIPGLGRSSGEGNGSSLWYSWPENPMDRGAWWATIYGIAELDMTEVT